MIADIVQWFITSFPHESIPDATVQAPHHYGYPLLLALILLLTVFDDYRDKEPLVPTISTVAGLYAFHMVWPVVEVSQYQPIGAALALLAPVVSTIAILNPWGTWVKSTSEGGYPWRVGLVIVFMNLFALDDAIEHAFPVPTPADTMFAIFGVWGTMVFIVILVLSGIIAFSGWDRLRLKLGLDKTG